MIYTLQQDNDIMGVFWLDKHHPNLISMHGFVSSGHLGFMTGQTFGNTISVPNFEVLPVAWKQHAPYLWSHFPNKTLQHAQLYVSKMIILDPDPILSLLPFGQANSNSLNHGVFSNGTQLPPPYPHLINDNLFADIPVFIKLTSTASIVALYNVLGKRHPNQPDVLSQDKLELVYNEQQHKLGHLIDSHHMLVLLSPCYCEKVL